jgi:hypothetical protein
MATKASTTTNSPTSTTTNRRGTATRPRRRSTSSARRASTATSGRNLAAPTAGRAAAPNADQVAERDWSNRPVVRAVVASEQAIQRNSVHVELPVIGVIHLPPADELVFIGGVAGLAIAGLLEWPVALLLGVGHAMATNRHNKLLRSFGDALSEA